MRSIAEAVIRQSGLEDYLKKIGGDELDELHNVEELISSTAEFDAENPQGSLNDFLAQVSLVSDADHMKGAGGAITLMTLHAAKGLEFPVVAMIGMEEGILPHSRSRGKYGCETVGRRTAAPVLSASPARRNGLTSRAKRH